MEQRTFTISRATWYRGHTSQGSYLRIPSGKFEGQMCCLGSIALQCGATPDQITAVTSPGMLARTLADEKFPAGLRALIEQRSGDNLKDNTPLARDMMSTNDHPDLSGEQRERTLIAYAAKIGWTLTFTD